ncbi:MAG: biopolymer transporter ExbD [Kiritimatiellae bacterium]|jgi:biopolymer transport protein ExbD|nr:biopolymer transporter ExbD [Kiritimatiellia bacterium]
MSKKARNNAGCDLDMTPMIDVVFQLIIFFIVTISIDQKLNEEIKLEYAKHGPIIEKEDPMSITVEVDKRGHISIKNAQFTLPKLQSIIVNRRKKFGEFPVFIRADKETKHADVKSVMDICTEAGLWRVSFVAMNEDKS